MCCFTQCGVLPGRGVVFHACRVMFSYCFGRELHVAGCMILMGPPSSGKSRRAEELRCHFIGRGMRCKVIGEESLGWPKHEANTEERSKRVLCEAMVAAMEKDVDVGTMIIVDSMIVSRKGGAELRREFCRRCAAIVQSRTCVVFCNTPIVRAWEWNERRGSPVQGAYTADLFEFIAGDLEIPDRHRNPFDRMCCVVKPEDDLPLDSIDKWIFKNRSSLGAFDAPLTLQTSHPSLERVELEHRELTYIEKRKKEIQGQWTSRTC